MTETNILEGFGFGEVHIKIILALFVRNTEFYETFGTRMKPSYFATIDPHAPHEIMEQIFLKAQDYYEKNVGKLITRDVLKSEIDIHFVQFKKDQKEKQEWYDLVDEIFDIEGLEETKDYYARQMKKFLIVQESKLTYYRLFEDFKNPTIDPEKALKDNISREADLVSMGSTMSPEVEGESLVFPKDAFQGFVKDFADTYSFYLESPYEFWVFDGATCLGNIFSTRVKLNTQLYVEPRMFTVCLGASGDTRKSESGRQTISLFQDIISDVEEVRYDEKGKRIPSKYFNTLWGCGSAEGLMDRLDQTPILILVYDELRSFVQKCDIKGSNLLQSVTSLFESSLLENATKGNYRRVDNAHLSLLAFCTIDTWETLFSPNFLDIGFINRLWIVPGVAEKKDFNPNLIPKHKKLELSIKFQRLLNAYPEDQPTIISLSHGAEVELNEWYHNLQSTEFTRRLEGYGLRLLLIMAISEKKKEVDEDMAKRVIKLLEWQRKVRETHQPSNFTSTMSRIENLMRQVTSKHPGISKGRLLSRIHSKQFDIWKVDKALENLLKHKELTQHWKGGVETYTFNKIDA